MARFHGIGPEGIQFLVELGLHQNKAWFNESKPRFESALKGPMGDLVEDLADRFAAEGVTITGDRKRSLFRQHRDTRFSANKEPYKTNVGACMTRSGDRKEPGLIYIHVEPDRRFVAAGFYMLPSPELTRFRRRIAEFPEAWKSVVASVGEITTHDSLKRLPRGFEDPNDEAIEAALKGKSHTVSIDLSDEEIASPALVDQVVAFTKKSMPLLEFGWAALAE